MHARMVARGRFLPGVVCRLAGHSYLILYRENIPNLARRDYEAPGIDAASRALRRARARTDEIVIEFLECRRCLELIARER